MTLSVVRLNPYFKSYFNKRKEQRLPFKKAILTTAHKLLRTIFAMLSRKTFYSISHPYDNHGNK